MSRDGRCGLAMDVIHQRCAGIDIGKADVKVCIRVPGVGTRRRTEVRTFSSMTRDLLEMRDWLMSEQVTLIGMEATEPIGSRFSICWSRTSSAGCSTPDT